MISFVTWPPFLHQNWPSDKANHTYFENMLLTILYVIQGVKNNFDKVTSWPQLISKFLVAPTYTLFVIRLLIGLAPFYALDVFV